MRRGFFPPDDAAACAVGVGVVQDSGLPLNRLEPDNPYRLVVAGGDPAALPDLVTWRRGTTVEESVGR